jgi:ADP-heptose:LPS heptosyltransferase
MKFLVIQTAFIGDVVLATPLVEKLIRFYPGAHIDFLLRKGNEKLLAGHPHIRRVWVWDKKTAKYRGLLKMCRQLRDERYDEVFNCQRFAAAGLLTAFSGAQRTTGFRKNPFSFLFNRRVPHLFGTRERPVHEVERNLALIEHLTDTSFEMPRLYPSPADFARVRAFGGEGGRYVCIAPTSVWFTKQYPAHKWVELIALLPADYTIYILGGPEDSGACATIVAASGRQNIQNVAGQLSFLESAALMQGAAMNYVNDSAPMHLASAVNAPVTAVFCSTVPIFGFTPLSKQSRIIETQVPLSCRPCGLHGRSCCPKGHFACAETITGYQFQLPD